ncbi:MAG: hypothetical protein E6G50_03530 [Actinobacteria bacterium]|nr:MAG: hypothetical protein E6G50_03530 [Actinomycetota bacterium]
MLVRHRFASGVVLVAIALVGSVFAFARPEYRQPAGGRTSKGTGYPAPRDASGARGWTWGRGQPGFLPSTGHEDWNLSEVGEHELDGARFDARLTAARPETVKLLAADRLGPRDLELLLSASDRHGATCIGAALPPSAAQFFCPSSTGMHRLGRQVAFVVVAARPPFDSRGRREFPYFVEGVARGDVVRVQWESPSIETVAARDGTTTLRERRFGQSAYDRKAGWWGTFGYTFTNAYLHGVPAKPWRARLGFYGANGVLATLDVRFNRPGERLYAVTP